MQLCLNIKEIEFLNDLIESKDVIIGSLENRIDDLEGTIECLENTIKALCEALSKESEKNNERGITLEPVINISSSSEMSIKDIEKAITDSMMESFRLLSKEV